MKYFSMRAALMLFVAFAVGLLLCSCSNGTQHVVVIPRMFSDAQFKDINLQKQVWRVSTDELAMVQVGDTIQFNMTYDNNSSTNCAIVIAKEDNN